MAVINVKGVLFHSAKGSTWETHKYIKKVAGNYYYPSGYENGRTIDSLKNESKKEKNEESPKSSETSVKSSLSRSEANKMGTSNTQSSSQKPGVLYIPKELAEESIKKSEANKMSEADVEDMALRTIRGEFGNGQVRKDLLGGNYQEIQDKVNELMKVIKVEQLSFTGRPPEVVEKGETAMKSATKKVSNVKVTESSKGIDMEQVQSVYRKKRT